MSCEPGCTAAPIHQWFNPHAECCQQHEQDKPLRLCAGPCGEYTANPEFCTVHCRSAAVAKEEAA